MACVPIAKGLFTEASDEARLLGSRCAACGVVTFPQQASCPRCAGETMEERPLPTRGTLWTWTTQEFPPKSPPYGIPVDAGTFEPYAVGYVELAGEVRIEARLVGTGPDDLAIGMEMELTLLPFRIDENGDEVVIPAFRPVD